MAGGAQYVFTSALGVGPHEAQNGKDWGEEREEAGRPSRRLSQVWGQCFSIGTGKTEPGCPGKPLPLSAL